MFMSPRTFSIFASLSYLYLYTSAVFSVTSEFLSTFFQFSREKPGLNYRRDRRRRREAKCVTKIMAALWRNKSRTVFKARGGHLFVALISVQKPSNWFKI